MSILIDKIRIANYRAIKEIEINLSPLTMLVGANNAGKTTFLKALNLALGIDKRNISKEDFFDDGTKNPDDNIILIDIRIIPFDIETGKRKPSVEMVIKIARLLNVSIDELLLDELELSIDQEKR